jgi:hypothetical protein
MQKKEAILTGSVVIIAAYTLILTLVGQAFPTIQTTKTLSSSGTITTIGVGVYLDQSCTQAVTSIPWGTIAPDSSQNFACYIRAEGTSPSTLSMYTSNWDPSAASQYIELNWDYSGATLDPGDVIAVTFTLSVSESIEGVTTFSFDITIVGSG